MSAESESDKPGSTTTPFVRVVRMPVPRATPFWSYVVLAFNIITYGAGLLIGQGMAWGLGAKVNEAILAGQFWRLFTALFLHADLLHLAFNSYALWIFGPQVEAPYGHLRFLLIYLVSGLGASAASFLFTPAASVGASGAIFGLVGATGAYLYRYRDRLLMGQRRLANLIGIVAYNLIYGFISPWVDNSAHIGGLVAGFALGWFMVPRYEMTLTDPAGPPRLVDRISVSRWLAGLSLVGLGIILTVVGGFLRWGG